MEDWKAELLVTIIGVIAAQALDELVQTLKRNHRKKKASRRRGKHFRRP